MNYPKDFVVYSWLFYKTKFIDTNFFAQGEIPEF